MKVKKWLSILVIAAMSFSLFSTLASAEEAAVTNTGLDIEGHWAESSLQKWVDSGLLKGYEDGSIKPDKEITRAEFTALVNRAFHFEEKSEISFTDVEAASWKNEQIAIAVKAGYVKGYEDATFRPDQVVSREEAAIMVSRILGLEAGSVEELDSFTDKGLISGSSAASIAALVHEGLMQGMPGGTFDPKGGFTRAQSVTLLEAALTYAHPTTTYDQAGVYGPETGMEVLKGDVIVDTENVTLRNVTIEGNLTITAAVGDGDAFFHNIRVNGDTIIEGGGENSIHFEDSVLVRVSINKRDGSVRVVVAGASSIQHVLVQSPVKLEESGVTDSGFANVEISDALPKGSEVKLTGQFESVDVFASDIKVSVPSGSIDKLNVQEGAGGTEINLSKEASVLNLVLNAVAKLLGEGKVNKADVNEQAKGSSFETSPEATTGDGAAASTPEPVSGGSGSVYIPTPDPESNTSPGPSEPSTPSEPSEPSTSPEPSEPSCSGECTSAALVDLTIGEEYTLNQLNSSYNNTGETGFSPDVFAYSIVIPSDVESIDIPLTVTQSTYTTAYYTRYDNNSYAGNGVLNDEPVILHIQGMTDSKIVIRVENVDGIRSKEYKLYFQYPRSIQEGSKLTRSSHYTPAHDDVAAVWEDQYTLVVESVYGERLQDTDTIRLFHNKDEQEVFTIYCSHSSCYIPNDELTETTGSWYMEIYRGETLLAAGEYKYDLTAIEEIQTDAGVQIVIPTREELIDTALSVFSTASVFRSGWEIYINKKIYSQHFQQLDMLQSPINK